MHFKKEITGLSLGKTQKQFGFNEGWSHTDIL